MTNPRATAWAWIVHAYTGAGAILAFGAVIAVFAGDYRSAFLLMFVALAIDATDGWLARRARVEIVLPGFDGRRLDDIVDYLNFVFVPAILIVEAGLLPESDGLGIGVAGVMLVASAYGFARKEAKSSDHFFTGFPSYWNIVALYLFVGDAPPAANAAVLLVLSGLVFVPIGYVYPSRTPTLRRLTIGLGILWALLVLLMILQLPRVNGALVGVSLAYPAYYGLLSLWLHVRRARAATS